MTLPRHQSKRPDSIKNVPPLSPAKISSPLLNDLSCHFNSRKVMGVARSGDKIEKARQGDRAIDPEHGDPDLLSCRNRHRRFSRRHSRRQYHCAPISGPRPQNGRRRLSPAAGDARAAGRSRPGARPAAGRNRPAGRRRPVRADNALECHCDLCQGAAHRAGKTEKRIFLHRGAADILPAHAVALQPGNGKSALRSRTAAGPLPGQVKG